MVKEMLIFSEGVIASAVAFSHEAEGRGGKQSRVSAQSKASGSPHKGTPIHYALKSRKAGWSRMPHRFAPRDDGMVQRFLKFGAAGGLLLVSSPALAAPDTVGSVLTVLLSLGLILGGFVAVAWFARRYLPGMGAQGAVKVVGTTAVGTRERVVVVEVDNTWLLLGVGGGNVRLLHTLPKPADSGKPMAERA